MIERKFILQKIKEKQIQDYIATKAGGHNKIEIKRTPLGEKIIVYTVRPGLIVGVKGGNIRELTETLKTKFGMENPQIEVEEIKEMYLNANAVADKITYTLERFGPKRFKFIGYDTLKNIMNAGAIGAEVVIGGRGVPGSRAKRWRFSAGHLKKSGDVAMSKVDKAVTVANLKSGSIGVKVSIMLPDTLLPDKILLNEEKTERTEEEIKEDMPKKKGKKKNKEKEEVAESNGDNKKE